MTLQIAHVADENKRKPTDEETAKCFGRIKDLMIRFENGSHDPCLLIETLQQVLEGKMMAKPSFGKLEYVQPVEKGKVLGGHDFVKESRRLANEAKVETLGDEAYDFYKKKENQHLLPGKETGINVVVFVEAQVASGGKRRVRYLYRGGAGWSEHFSWLDNGFNDSCAAAVSQVGPKISES